jgi:hypothetical protein
VKAMNGDKAPGPDGFSMAFFQACCVVLKEDIMKVFPDFHARGKFERSLNASFISLILKTLGAVDLKDFHPSSLVQNIYKIIAKILANKLKMVLEKLISKSHNAFIRGRQVLDPILISNECLDSRLRSNELGVICKMDLERGLVESGVGFKIWQFMGWVVFCCAFWCVWGGVVENIRRD